MFLPRCALFVLFLWLVQPSFPQESPTSQHRLTGVIVEKLEKDCALNPSWPRENDILLSWTRGDHKGQIQSPFDLWLMYVQERPYGPITVQGRTGKETKSWQVGPEYWCFSTRPSLSHTSLLAYRRSDHLLRTGALKQAVIQWRTITERYPDEPWLYTWFLYHGGNLLQQTERWYEAGQLYQQAARAAIHLDPIITINLLQHTAFTFRRRGDLDTAKRYYQHALLKAQQLGDQKLVVARSLMYLGSMEMSDDLTKATDYFSQAKAIQQKIVPYSFDLAQVFLWIGYIAAQGGDLYRAEQLFRQAQSILERIGSKAGVAEALLYLAAIPQERGDISNAEKFYRQALLNERRLGYSSRDYAWALNGLSEVAHLRGQLAKADYYQRQALAMYQELNPESVDTARALLFWAMIVSESGDWARAEGLGRRAVRIEEKIAPGTLDLADAFTCVGEILLDQGALTRAKRYLNRALAIHKRLTPGRAEAAYTLEDLGELHASLGNFRKAEENYTQAIQILEKAGPSTSHLAQTLASFAGTKQQERQFKDAQNLYERAMAVLENQVGRLGGGTEIHASFRARFADVYRAYIGFLVQQGNSDIAFQVMERSRARSLAEALANGHFEIHKGVDPQLLEQERSLSEKFTARSNYRIHLLSREHSEERIKTLDKEIAELLIQYQDVQEQIRSASTASIQPQALSTSQIQQQLLDDKTLLLEYSLGEERSFLFALTPTTLHSYQLPSRKHIDRAARQVYSLLTARNHAVRGESKPQRNTRLQKQEARYMQAVKHLSRMILAPAASELQGKRLLIVTDGALAYIPFALLPSPQTSKPLMAEHEIVNLPSASVLAVLRQQERNRVPAPKAVAVLADPVFSKDDPRVCAPDRSANAAYRRLAPCLQGAGLQADMSEANPSAVNEARAAPPAVNFDAFEAGLPAHLLLRSAGDVGLRGTGQLHLNRLPYTRREAAAVAALTPPDQRLEALDFRASRDTAMSADLAQYRIVHFATHGLLDSRHAELSGLVLSLVDEQGQPQNGFLELQDIYNMNLSADLVVLSACETGLGKEVDGEGLVGLTRGFMYAGASRVLASLWRVDDEATAALMKRFYEGMLREGKTAAAALREAQLWMQGQKKWREPYYWAGFVLQGDWK